MSRYAPPIVWDFETEPEFQENFDWAADFVHSKGRAGRRPRRRPPEPRRPHPPGDRPTAAADREDARPLGVPPRPRARRPGVRSAQVGAAQRDPRGLAVRAGGVRSRRRLTPATRRFSPTTAARSSNRGTSRPLLDGEIVSCFSMTELQRPSGWSSRPEPSSTATNGSSTARSGSRAGAAARRFIIVMAVTDPDNEPYHRHEHVRRAPRRRRGLDDHPERPRRWRLGHPTRHTPTCATTTSACRPTTCWVRVDAWPPSLAQTRARGRAHPPHDARRRHGTEHARHDVRAGGLPERRGRAARTASRWCRR